MTFELLGMVGTRDASETHGDLYGTIDPDYLTRFARAHEEAGFDRTRPTLWIAEALTFFLTEEQAAGLLRLLASASAPGTATATKKGA